MKGKNVLICGSADISRIQLKEALESADTIVAADGGYDILKALSVTPDVLLGDMDSIKDLPKGLEPIKYPEDKDKSDLELALEYVSDNYPEVEKISFAGVVSDSRLDHTLANIYCALNYSQNISIYSTDAVIEVINNPGCYSYSLCKGSLVSILAVVPGEIKTEGLKYSVNGSLNTPSHGISNQVLDKDFSVEVLSGKYLLFLQ